MAASAVEIIDAPNCFLRAAPYALAPSGAAILLVPVGAASYLVSSSFFKAGFTGAIFVGPVAGAVVVVVEGVPLLASVALVVSLFSFSCLSLSSYSFFSSTALTAVLPGYGFTGNLDGGLTALLAVVGATAF